LKDDNANIRRGAAWAFEWLGPDARAAIPALLDALQGDERAVAHAAAAAIGQVGVSDVRALLPLLPHRDARVRGRAALTCELLGPRAKEAVPGLLQALRDEDGIVRRHAAAALGRAGASDLPTVRPALMAALKDKEPLVRIEAAEALGQLHLEIDSAVTVLISAVRDPDDRIRWRAIIALGRIGPPAKDAAAFLGQARNDKNPVVAADAIRSLGRLGKPGVTILVERLLDRDLAQRKRAYAALIVAGPAAQDAVPRLFEAFNRQDADDAEYLATTLRQLGPVAIPTLMEALQAKENYVRSNAISILGRIGKDAAEAKPRLIAALRDEDEKVRTDAAFALARIDPNGSEGLRIIVSALTHTQDYESFQQLTGLGERIAPLLSEAIQNPDPAV